MNRPDHPKEALAESRTGYAEDRTVLANERTYASWMRAGLAALASGLAFQKFLGGILPSWGVRTIAVVLIVVSGLVFATAEWRYSHLGVKLRRAGIHTVPAIWTRLLSLLLISASIVALVGVWLV